VTILQGETPVVVGLHTFSSIKTDLVYIKIQCMVIKLIVKSFQC